MLDNLTDDDWQVIVGQITAIRGRDVVSIEEVRSLINNWIATAVLRGHPDFVADVEKNVAATKSGELYRGLDPDTRARLEAGR
ncbi:MAG TPA: hypothetical protein VGC47_10120 [Acidimicrobiia bacterium]|jgi:hypothetical protein